ncbi:cytokine receptor common subunit gamma-like [Bombina bombina]|uniref:cytokine receptor common subunit gamma-like n=1 Tax=Bombina bombina TaxID=8345 RepID=UPI00235ABF47|nr:cytokine receptor common subunit gamma-like [Bombina bombina]
MWNQQGTPKENYTLYYRILNFESQPALPCRNYLQDGQINIGCWINAPTVNLFSPFVVQLNSTNRDKPIIREYERMQTMVKLDPPYNLTIKATNHSELLLQWQFDHGHFPVLCICFQVEHQNMASKEGKVKEVRSALFSLPSYDPKQIYTFRVRNKLCEICADAKMWSEWSEEITWGKNETLIVEASIVQSLVISLMSSVLLLVLLFLLIRMERIWVILVPRIPNPGKKFEDLIKIHKGDFQEWLGISKEAVESFKHNYTETLCSVSEDPEFNGGDAKRHPPNGPTNQNLLN